VSDGKRYGCMTEDLPQPHASRLMPSLVCLHLRRSRYLAQRSRSAVMNAR